MSGKWQLVGLSLVGLILILIAGLSLAQGSDSQGALAGAPTVVSYQGQVTVSGSAFNGTGYFKFAVVDAAGTTTYWSNDDTSVDGGEPDSGSPLPVTNGLLSSHFGHCDQFVLYDVDADGTTVGHRRELSPPPHEPGTFPRWLHEQDATVIIAGGMGSRAQSLFGKNSIQVVVGATDGEPDLIVRSFLDGQLTTGANVCDH